MSHLTRASGQEFFDDAEFRGNPRGGRCRHSRFLQTQQNFLVDGVELCFLLNSTFEAETHDVQRDRGKQFKMRIGIDQLSQVSGLRDVLLNQRLIGLQAMLLQTEPYLQGAESPREFQTILAKRDGARRKTSTLSIQVRGPDS